MSRKFFVVSLIFMMFVISGCATCSFRKNDNPCPSKKSSDGRTMISGTTYAPLENSYVYVYREGDDRHGPAFATSEATDINGSYSLELPAGTYYLVTRQRQRGGVVGPLVPGDLKSRIIGPVTVKEGMTLNADMTCEVKADNLELFEVQGMSKTRTSFSGVIRDAEGNPAPSIRVHVYKYIQMSERPKFVSAATGPDGKYRVYLPKGGTYYLCARDSFGGPPKLGDLYGRYDGGAINPSALVINEGEGLKGIDITVQRVW